MKLISRFLLTFGLSILLLATAAHSQNRPEVVQQLDGFLRPTAAAFSPGGKSLYVVNHAQGEAGTLRSESFLSKLSVDSEGRIATEQLRFTSSLTAPIDLDFSPVAFGEIPKGAIFLLVGSPIVQNDEGRGLKDLSRILIGLQIVDPRTGRIIKKVDLSPNSDIRLTADKNLLAPSSICFDSRGNLYLGEAGVGGHMFERRQVGQPGIWRLEGEAVQELLAEGSPSKVDFIRTSSLPSDMGYRDSESMLYFVTNHNQGRPSGSVFRISAGKYEGISSMQTIVRDVDALSGIALTPAGRVLIVGNSGELMFPKGRKNTRPIRFRPKHTFSTPGKIGLLPMDDGTMLIAIPEQSSDAGLGKGQRVSIVRLPQGY